MGVVGNLGKSVSRSIAPKVTGMAPHLTGSFVHQALHRAIVGVGPLPGAVSAADSQLEEQHGDVDRAIREVVENHVRFAGAQGFVTNLGGLVTMALTIPANISGLALVQCRMVAGIAHLRGYDVADPRVRNAVLACVLGEETVTRLVKARKLPAPPMAIATAPTYDAELGDTIAGQVATELIAKAAGKRLATTVGRRVPVVGGVVGASADAYGTWQIGRYAGRELRPRTLR